MAELKRDENGTPCGAGGGLRDILQNEGDDLVSTPLRVDPDTNALLVALRPEIIIATVTNGLCRRDENGTPTYYGISDTDGETLVPIRTDSVGNLLVDTP